MLRPYKKIPSSAALVGLLICAAAHAPAPVDTEALDYASFLQTPVPHPDPARPAPSHPSKTAPDGNIPTPTSQRTLNSLRTQTTKRLINGKSFRNPA